MDLSSPFSKHLHTNYVPSDFEARQIKTHLVSYSSEVSRLDALIRDLSVQRGQIVEYIHAHQALVSPARRLPWDIVQEIFLACLPTHRNAVMSSTEAPLVLTHICISTPSLWSSLHLPLGFIFEHGLNDPVVDWLKRSGGCPVSLSIVGSPNLESWEDSDAAGVNTIMKELTRSANRWNRVQLIFDSDEGLLRLADLYAPKLQAISMECKPDEMLKMKLLTTPSLREVEVRMEREFDTYIPQMPLRWDGLTRLSIHSTGMHRQEGLSPYTAIGILERCPRLHSFNVYLSNGSHFPMDGVRKPLLLPALKEFSILQTPDAPMRWLSITYLLVHFIMPHLQHLHLPRTSSMHLVSKFPLKNLAPRSPLIVELSLDLTRLPEVSLFDNLRILSSLERLVVFDNCDVLISFPQHFEVTAQSLLAFLRSSPVCPLLQHIQINACDTEVSGHLLEFVRGRLDGGSGEHFKRLDVQYKNFVPPIRRQDLAPFVARGVTISTSCPPDPLVALPSSTPWVGIDE